MEQSSPALPTLLSSLGLDQREAQIYLALAEMGKSTAGSVSRRVHIPRATVYGVLNTLRQKGLVVSEYAPGTTLFQISSPDCFVRMIENEKEALERKEKAAAELGQAIRPYLSRSRYNIPRLQFVEDQRNVENLLSESLQSWRRGAGQESEPMLRGYEDHTFVEQYQKWLTWRWKTSIEEARFFSNRSAIQTKLEGKIPRRHIRVLPSGFEFSSSIWVWGDEIIMAMTRQKPHYGFRIIDTTLASNLRISFDLLWQLTEAEPKNAA